MSEKISEPNDENVLRLITLAQQGDMSAQSELLVSASELVHHQIKNFCNSGIEPDDLRQEGMMGALNAIRTYRADGGASFKTYAGVCVRNRLLSVAGRRSRKSVFSDETVSLENNDFLVGRGDSAEENLIDKVSCEDIVAYINSILSVKERETLRLFLSGLSYEEIAKRTGSTPKSVDNALQRVRQKLKKYNG